MSLFGSLYVGTSGLQTSQNALNTTAHNMANVDTAGYTRQQILLGTRSYNTLSVNASAVSYQQLGLGVYYSQVRQVRDQFLDQAYRKESGRTSFYETNSNVIEEVEDLFGEFQGVEFSEALDNLWKSIEELSKDPCKLTNQGLFVARADELLTRAALVYKGMSDKQDNMNKQVKNTVDKINDFGQELSELNKAIMRIESGSVESANDLRDRRNSILDELAKFGDMSYDEDRYGVVTVRFEGIDFVNADSVNKLELYQDQETGFYTPYWSQLATYRNIDGERQLDLQSCRLYDPNEIISFNNNTDIGSLRATLLARGEKRATHHDLKDQDIYNKDIAQSLLMNVQAEFDSLINKITTVINNVLKEAAETYPNSDYMKDKDGNPLQLFQLVSDDPEVGYTIGNIIINNEIKNTPSILSFRLPDGNEDLVTTGKLVKAMSADYDIYTGEAHTLNPNLKTKSSLLKFYSALVTQITVTGESNKELAEYQGAVMNETFSAREQVLGVSTEEELEFMIKFQNAYNASSRYINVIDDMMEHILSTLGR